MIIIHGDNIVASRNTLHQKKSTLKAQGIKEIISLDGKKVVASDLIQALESQSLFGEKRAVIIENLLSRPKSKDKTEVEKYLQTNPSGETILWEGKKLTTAQLAKYKGHPIEEAKSSPVTFVFLDSLGSNLANSLDLLHKALENESEGSLFFMFARQVRLLILATEGLDQGSPWQKAKLAKQAHQLGLSALLYMHDELTRIDQQIKTGLSTVGLGGELEVLVIRLYHKMYEKV